MEAAQFRGGAVRICTTLLSIFVACTATAQPYRPGSDSDVIERLPIRAFGASSVDALRIRAGISAQPDALDLALRLAQRHVAAARANADPRLLGQAQAVLSPWWHLAAPPVPVLVLRATIRQSNHDFAAASADLQQAVQREPTNAQAWLTLASVQQVIGDLGGARASCARLRGLVTNLVTVTCAASVDSISGRATAAYEALKHALVQATPLDKIELRTWAMTLQAETAERLDRSEEAEKLYRASLAQAASDAYTLAAYADFLLDANRATEVISLIAADTPVDTLLLRRAQAAHRLGSADAMRTVSELGARIAASRARGDRVHLREEARYTLELAGDAASALSLAQENWRVQKEPLDARILLECALAAGEPAAAAEVMAWIDRTALEGDVVKRLAARMKPQ